MNTNQGFTEAPDCYPNHLRCTECETLVHNTNVKRHDCWTSRLSQQFPKSSNLILRSESNPR